MAKNSSEGKGPIGLFDSGVGGLTVAHALHTLLPNEQLVYFGDTAHLPYGDKSRESIVQYSLGITDFLTKPFEVPFVREIVAQLMLKRK